MIFTGSLHRRRTTMQMQGPWLVQTPLKVSLDGGVDDPFTSRSLFGALSHPRITTPSIRWVGNSSNHTKFLIMQLQVMVREAYKLQMRERQAEQEWEHVVSTCQGTCISPTGRWGLSGCLRIGGGERTHLRRRRTRSEGRRWRRRRRKQGRGRRR